MLDSFKHFMAGLIDYAGLFPPAKLDLNTAIKNYASYLKSPAHWMLSNFIIPATKLHELTPEMISQFKNQGGLNLSIISQNMSKDLESLVEFRDKYRQQINLNFIETRLHTKDDVEQIIAINNQLLEQANLNSRVFYETEFDANWRGNILLTCDQIARANKNSGRNDGFKLRCGGVEASMFPSAAQVAIALKFCQEAGVAMKFTAGLHHPVRHYDAVLKIKRHGFMNIFIAGMIGLEHGLDYKQSEEIIREEKADEFEFSEEGLSYKKFVVKTQRIRKLRETNFISYGSCSFDEPREDLKALGLLK